VEQRAWRPPEQRSEVRAPALEPETERLLGADEEVVAGRRPVEEAFAARREALRLLVVPERRSALDQLVLHATTLRIPVVEVEGGTLTAISGFDGHQGVALVVAPRHRATLDEVLAIAGSRGEPPFLLVLDHLEDPQNVGALMRSAEASGVHGVVLPAHGSAPLSPAAVKGSAGAAEHLAVVIVPDLAAGLVDLHTRGLRIVGADAAAQMTVREVDLRGPLAIVVGNEGRGLTSRLRRRIDVLARIPMHGRVASLNASVAGAILLYEAAAQRDLPENDATAQTRAAAQPEAPPQPAAIEEPEAAAQP
jgi:23S rRNA (guanosine2251-2'-O)-methyltransferase